MDLDLFKEVISSVSFFLSSAIPRFCNCVSREMQWNGRPKCGPLGPVVMAGLLYGPRYTIDIIDS